MSNTETKINLEELTLEIVQQGFASGAFTSESLTQAYLDRIAEFNPTYNAIVFFNDDALDEARAIDARRAAGEELGPLAGVPIVVKEAMDMKGFPTTGGWEMLYSKAGGVDLYPDTDAPVVARMRAAGAVILGKTNIPILSHTGAHANGGWAGGTCNSAGREFLPGGSSAGTATAVGGNFCVLGLAEETGGSIQNPASAQGLVGIKPTFALVPNAGVMPLSSLRDVVGPIARCVRDAALTLDALAGFTIEDPKTIAGVGRKPKGGYTSKLDKDALTGKRIGLYGPGWRTLPLSEETADLYGQTQKELISLGAELVSDPFAGSGFVDLRKPSIPGAEFDARGMESICYDMERYLQRMGPNVALKSFDDFARATASQNAFGSEGVLSWMHNVPEFVEAYKNPSNPPDMSSFIALRETYLDIFNSVFEQQQLDAVIYPQMRGPLGPLHGDDYIHETVVSEVNIAGLPAVTVPAGFYGSGAPYNIVIVAPQWAEADILAIAYSYEQGTQHRRAPKLTVG
ncbi:amidase [Phaeobacter gallaeciensis]|uniref:amidase n=1 Tax=Phaeobacter gallaeciensis TaxID=60890 RepID=UPI00237FCED1|nr:amidase [Phaeobacter gallaeciensis]MDE4305829.1 amidase [Phaeobacter gallaeciensis]MDE4310190.1 amidase [Phaeobacter gallaeciensis]MDE4314702.1 amidase [Phaeobacter gallaeciensis]MDE4319093.1 amidase [Phaeobacter gallaeciensis]MDE4323579.1 amidase [Phaeobacter gallaeciensis]